MGKPTLLKLADGLETVADSVEFTAYGTDPSTKAYMEREGELFRYAAQRLRLLEAGKAEPQEREVERSPVTFTADRLRALAAGVAGRSEAGG